MAVQLIADLYGCSEIINDTEAIKRAAHRAIEYVGADIVEECIHKFEPIGGTYFAEKIVMRSVQREIAPEPGTPAEAADTEQK